ncbi:DMT family transporter [Lachnospiraceae bacterium NSJ-143]|nr:DMT family transporter [Lachnospiraceae bacterium NSJ-143]
MKNRIMIILTMIVWSTTGVFSRKVTLPSYQITFFRYLIALSFMFLVFKIQRRKLNFSKIRPDIKILIISGAALALNSMMLIESYKYTTISKATVCYYVAPVIVTVLSKIFFKEHIGLKKIICLIITFAGIILTAYSKSAATESNPMLGIGCALLAAVFYAIVTVGSKSVKSISGIDLTVVQFLIGFLTASIYAAFSGGISMSALDFENVFNLFIIGIVYTGLAFLVYFSAIKNIPGHEAALLSYTEPASAVFISYFFLNEGISVPQVIGAVMVIGAMAASETDIKALTKHKVKEQKNDAL